VYFAGNKNRDRKRPLSWGSAMIYAKDCPVFMEGEKKTKSAGKEMWLIAGAEEKQLSREPPHNPLKKDIDYSLGGKKRICLKGKRFQKKRSWSQPIDHFHERKVNIIIMAYKRMLPMLYQKIQGRRKK